MEWPRFLTPQFQRLVEQFEAVKESFANTGDREKQMRLIRQAHELIAEAKRMANELRVEAQDRVERDSNKPRKVQGRIQL